LARRIVARHDGGDRVVVVVSAMGKSTDALVRQARELAEHPTRAKWTCSCRPASASPSP
jgi:aspartate kinase (EC 2.7.2.4)